MWGRSEARRFTIFVFLSMLAYSAQDLILGAVRRRGDGLHAGTVDQPVGVQHGGVLAGMLMAAFAGSRWLGAQARQPARGWTVGGCLVLGGCDGRAGRRRLAGPSWPFSANVFLLGVANGAFSIAAIGSMMQLAGEAAGTARRAHGPVGRRRASPSASADCSARRPAIWRGWSSTAPAPAYASVFAFEGAMFVVAARIAAGRAAERPRPAARRRTDAGQRHGGPDE